MMFDVSQNMAYSQQYLLISYDKTYDYLDFEFTGRVNQSARFSRADQSALTIFLFLTCNRLLVPIRCLLLHI